MIEFNVHEGTVSEHGGCMACSWRNSEKVFVIRMGNIETRLCQQHIDELHARTRRVVPTPKKFPPVRRSIEERLERIEMYLSANGSSFGRPFKARQ